MDKDKDAHQKFVDTEEAVRLARQQTMGAMEEAVRESARKAQAMARLEYQLRSMGAKPDYLGELNEQ